MLKEREEEMLEWPFEMILSQINMMPIKFIFGECQNDKFDKLMQMKLGSFLLERLRKEFDDSIQH